MLGTCSLTRVRKLALGVGIMLLLGLGAAMLGAFGAPADLMAHFPGGVRPALAESERAEVGVSYRFQLPTHCGVEYAFFDDRWWNASTQLYENQARMDPPPGWGNPTEFGTMRLLSQDEAQFVGDSGNKAHFASRSEGSPGTTCG